MLMPKRVKRRRVHRGRMKGVATKGNKVTYGDYGLVATECGWITSNQIEAARIAMTRSVKRGGKVYIKIFPHKPVTKKPAEVRMGSGKGAPEYWVAVVKPGRVMFEIEGVTEAQAREAMRLASHKLPVKCKDVYKRQGEDKNIFPFNGEADVLFNSALAYELAILKKHAQPLLQAIERSEPEYSDAQRLLSFLNFFEVIEDESIIPNNSILREFIGGSIFSEYL